MMQLASRRPQFAGSLQNIPAVRRDKTLRRERIFAFRADRHTVCKTVCKKEIRGALSRAPEIERRRQMKIFKRFAVGATIGTLSAACCANTADTTTSNDSPSVSPYRAQEFSIDGFASGSIGKQTIDHLSGDTVEHDGRLGAGGGLNFFFNRHIGIGGDAYTENTADHFIDSASGNLIARLPLGRSGVAPYIFGGGGHQFDEVAQTFGQAGAGIELRFMQHAGIFIDARYVVPDRTDNYGVGRAGLRINF